jgi:hypothetical protein
MTLRIKRRKAETCPFAKWASPTQLKEMGNLMKRTIYAVTAVSLAWLLLRMAPDIRRYMRMRAM